MDSVECRIETQTSMEGDNETCSGAPDTQRRD